MNRSTKRLSHLFFLLTLVVLWLSPVAASAATKPLLNQQPLPAAKILKKVSTSEACDLIVSNINMSPGKPTTNDDLIIWTFIKNVGPIASPPTSLQLQIGGKIYPLIDVPALPVNQEWRYTSKVKALSAQNYRITATVNPQKQTKETKYANNKRIKNFTVTTGPSLFIKNITWDRPTKVWVATVKNATLAPVHIGIVGFPLENGQSGMTKWANTHIPGHGTFELVGDYSSYNVPVGTRLKVHVKKKNSDTIFDEKIITLD
jgi:hypothetical protein